MTATITRPETVLSQAAKTAGHAPSVHNTQPWRWRVHRDVLELRAHRGSQLQAADPEGRLLTISCGAALHHAQAALAAQGWSAEVQRLPDPADPDLLARVILTGQIRVIPEATRTLQALGARRTDRRPVSTQPPSSKAIDEVRRAGSAEGVNIHVLTPEQTIELGAAAARADQTEIMDPEQRRELTYWIGGDRPEGAGMPLDVIPNAASPGLVPGRDFVRSGSMAAGRGTDRYAVYLMLFGRGDEPADWLRAGEALSSAWLVATEKGLSVLPFSSVIEVDATRAVMREILSGLGYPYLVLRLGNPDREYPQPPHTPRLPAEQTVEIT